MQAVLHVARLLLEALDQLLPTTRHEPRPQHGQLQVLITPFVFVRIELCTQPGDRILYSLSSLSSLMMQGELHSEAHGARRERNLVVHGDLWVVTPESVRQAGPDLLGRSETARHAAEAPWETWL